MSAGAIENKRLIARESDGELETIYPGEADGARDVAFIKGILWIITENQNIGGFAIDQFLQFFAFYDGKYWGSLLFLG